MSGLVADLRETCASRWSDTVAACDEQRAEAADRIEKLEAALAKVDAIRNDIIRRQTVNWSAHIYPLVAALNDAGIKGSDRG